MDTKNSNNTKFLDPVQIVSQIDIEGGDVVVDFGCGSGYFSLELAKKIGNKGEVYAIDVLPSALEAVLSRAKTLGLSNIVAKRANLEGEKGSGLGADFADIVVMKDMLFQNKDKKAILKEAHKVLKPHGKAVIVEWNDKDLTIGPEKKLRISKENLEKMAAEAGFKVEKELKAGDFHYSVLLSKKS